MLNVIIGILLVSLASASGFMLIEQMSLTVAVADMRENSRRLDMAADAVAAKLGVPAGASQSAIYAPAAKNGSGIYEYSQLPDSIAGVHTTVGGVPFRYCPYAPDAGPETVSSGYLVKGGVPAADVGSFRPAGILIAAGLKGGAPAGCGDVRLVQGRLTVPGGLVRMISGVKGVSDAQLTDGSSFEVWVAPDAGGTGADAEHPASLASAMNVWKGRLPKSMVIHVPDAAVFTGADALFRMDSQPAGTVRSSKLSIVCSTGTDAPCATGAVISANATFDPQGSIALVGVSLPQTVVRLASHNAASFQGMRVAGVGVASGSSAAFNGNVTIQGGGLVVAGDVTVEKTLTVSGSSSSSLIEVASGGRLSLANAQLGLANGLRGIELSGDLSGNGVISVSSVGAAVALQNGSRMAFSGTIGSGSGSSTVLAEGAAASISGTGSFGPGTNGCWNPSVAGSDGMAVPTIFGASSPGSSAPTGLAQPAAPAADPQTGTVKADAMAAYVLQSNSYTRAMAASAGNKSNWSCGG